MRGELRQLRQIRSLPSPSFSPRIRSLSHFPPPPLYKVPGPFPLYKVSEPFTPSLLSLQ